MGQADGDIRDEDGKGKSKKKVSKKKDDDAPIGGSVQEESGEGEKRKKKKKDEEGGAEGEDKKKKKKNNEEGEKEEPKEGDEGEKRKKKKKDEESGAEGEDKKKKKKNDEEGGKEEPKEGDENKKKKKKKGAEPEAEKAEDGENKKKKKKKADKSDPALTKEEIVEIMCRVTKDGEFLFTQKLTAEDRCVSCGHILRIPVLFEDCNHRCCSSCLSAILKSGQKCPADKTSLKQERIKVDKDYQAKMDLYDVQCSWLEQGCPWSGQLGTLGPHLGSCEFTLVDCPNDCGEKIQRRQIDKHVNESCRLRTTKCKFCDYDIPTEKEMAHYDVCPLFPLACPNGCKVTNIARNKLAEHMKNSCTKQNLSCPFAEHGCDFQGLKGPVENHCENSILAHLTLLNASVHQMSVLLEAQSKAFSDYKALMTEQTKRVTRLELCSGASFVWKIDEYDEKLRLAKTGKQTTIFSPGFYTHRCGYRMVLSACLNGSGDGKNKYMSVYCAICRGDHDTLLQWPFAHELKFQLLDQNPDVVARKPVQYVVKPDPTPEQNMFLGRPTSERNAFFGAPRFVRLDVLQNSTYTVENCMFLKVTLGLDEMSPV
ncbi:unnamed protein product [Calicophoron daubneyi]|uniref:Uncharacterized protein n=1 Tax=Calicophoron daubneyi TaxID=300641 RepID=A0AAV2TC03_CALDB